MTKWSGDFSRLRQELGGFEILPRASSTNDFLKSAVFANYTAVLTDNQTSGRGRLGRTWVSQPGQGLAFSLLVPLLSARQQQWLPLVTGAVLVDSIRSRGISGAHLKWPNDVLVEEKKIAGVLCEVHPDGRVIVGIGLNICSESGEAPSPGAASLSEFVEVTHNLVDHLLTALVISLRRFCTSSGEEALFRARQVVTDVISTLGREVSVHNPDGTVWRGFAQSLSENGHLVVRESLNGQQRSVVASDVTHLRQ